MKHDKGEMKFPALRAFMRSYLHQDFGEEYGSAGGAAKAFREDATEEEVAAVVKEWGEFLAAARGKALDEVNELLAGKLGSAWRVGSLAELDGMSEALEK
jgi:hypothetical protein